MFSNLILVISIAHSTIPENFNPIRQVVFEILLRLYFRVGSTENSKFWIHLLYRDFVKDLNIVHELVEMNF